MALITYGILIAIFIGLIYVAVPWAAKLKIRKRFLSTTGKSPVVYITFDDGPSPESTPRILSLLKKVDAKATFFALGKHIERYPDIARSIVANGHELGEHSYAHYHAWRSGPLKTLRDLVRGGKALNTISSEDDAVRYFRPPFGKMNLVSLLYIWLGKKRVAFWNVDPRDWQATSAKEVANHVIRNLQPGNVILLHDGRYHNRGDVGVTVEALAMILNACREKGLRTATLRENVSPPRPSMG